MKGRGWLGPVVLSLVLGALTIALTLLPSAPHPTEPTLLVPTWAPIGWYVDAKGGAYAAMRFERGGYPEAHAIWARLSARGVAEAAIAVDAQQGGASPILPGATALKIAGHPAGLFDPNELVFNVGDVGWSINANDVPRRTLIRFANHLTERSGAIHADYIPRGFKLVSQRRMTTEAEGDSRAWFWDLYVFPFPPRANAQIEMTGSYGQDTDLWDFAWDRPDGEWSTIRGHRAYITRDAAQWFERPGFDVVVNWEGMSDTQRDKLLRSLREVSPGEWQTCYARFRGCNWAPMLGGASLRKTK